MQLKIPLKNGSSLFINKFMRKRSKKTGLPPGSMVHVGEKKVEQVKLSVIDYDQDNIEKRDLKNVEEAFPFKDTPTVRPPVPMPRAVAALAARNGSWS